MPPTPGRDRYGALRPRPVARHNRSDEYERTFRNREDSEIVPAPDLEEPDTAPVPVVSGESLLVRDLEDNHPEEETPVSDTSERLNELLEGPEETPPTGPGFTSVSLPQSTTRQGNRCIGIAEEALALFINKNNGYGDPDTLFGDLGSRGAYSDIHRKFKLLHRYLWLGQEWTNTESFEEVVYDLIGHLLLTVDFRRRGE